MRHPRRASRGNRDHSRCRESAVYGLRRPIIAGLSLGATRTFRLRRDGDDATIPRPTAVLAQAIAQTGCVQILLASQEKPRHEFSVAREKALHKLTKFKDSAKLEVLGLDGPVGFSEQILGYLYGGAPGGDDPRIFNLHFSWRLVPDSVRPARARADEMARGTLAWV